MIPILLSKVKPDFDSLVLQLQLALSTKKTWLDMQTSGTGQTLLEAISAIGAFNEFGVELSFREAFPSTALRDSSIYASTDMLGVHITRKTPAFVSVPFTRTDTVLPYLIPRLSTFTIDGVKFFNRDPIVFSSGQATSTAIDLFQGELKTKTFQGKSIAFQEVLLEEPNFVVSDNDVYVSLINTATEVETQWSEIEEGLWLAELDEPVYYDRTDGNGDVLLQFGDGNHGQIPPIGYNIQVIYAVTTGSAGNNGAAGIEVQYDGDSNIKGITTTPIVGGADEKDSGFYKVFAPHIKKSGGRAVNYSDYKAIATSYPGVACAEIKAQRDIAPNDLRWMNVIRVCILPDNADSFTLPEWNAFELWFNEVTHAAVQIQRYDPTRMDVSVSLTIALKASAVPGEVLPVVQQRIQALFEKTTDSLGKRIAVSDIHAAADVADVDYVVIHNPVADFYLTSDINPEAPYIWWNLTTLDIQVKYSERRYYNDRL